MPRRACSASGTSTACRRSPRNASSARSCSEPVSRASATTPCTSIPSGRREQRPHALVEGGVGGHHLLERGAAAGEAVPLALQRVRLAAERLGAAPRLVGARGRRRRGPRRARPGGPRPRARGRGRPRGRRPRGRARRSSSEVSAASFSRSAAARSALPATDAREFCSVAILPRSATCDSRPRSCPASASACRAAASATAASAASELGLRRAELVVELLLLRAPAGERLGEGPHAGDELLLVARRLLGPDLVLRRAAACSSRCGPGGGPRRG